jgi:hypothetical protein
LWSDGDVSLDHSICRQPIELLFSPFACERIRLVENSLKDKAKNQLSLIELGINWLRLFLIGYCQERTTSVTPREIIRISDI